LISPAGNVAAIRHTPSFRQDRHQISAAAIVGLSKYSPKYKKVRLSTGLFTIEMFVRRRLLGISKSRKHSPVSSPPNYASGNNKQCAALVA